MTEEQLFELAINTPEAERDSLLNRECAGNGILLARRVALLNANVKDGDPSLSGTQSIVVVHKGWEAGQVVAGRYTLIDVIGEGGMGSVWRAKQQRELSS